MAKRGAPPGSGLGRVSDKRLPPARYGKSDAVSTVLSAMVGKRLYAARMAARVTQGVVAAKSGVSLPTYMRAETGYRTVHLELLYRIASALDCEIWDILPSRADYQTAFQTKAYEEAHS